MPETATEIKESYTKYCKNYIKNNINDYDGIIVYACDLGHKLTEEINADGTATFSKQEAMDYLKSWFDDVGMVFDYMKFTYGEVIVNPFEDPERYHVVMIIEGVCYLLSQCKTIGNAWNEEIELTPEIIGKILQELDEIDGEIEL